jgi:hypothetical protein
VTTRYIFHLCPAKQVTLKNGPPEPAPAGKAVSVVFPILWSRHGPYTYSPQDGKQNSRESGSVPLKDNYMCHPGRTQAPFCADIGESLGTSVSQAASSVAFLCPLPRLSGHPLTLPMHY